MKTNKLGIIGLGHVGDHVLAYAAASQLFGEIVTIDPKEDQARGMALDQAHATGLPSRQNVTIHAGDYEDLKDADIIIITATFVYPPGELPADRQALIDKNAAIIRSIMENICAVTKDAILIFISNPVDTVVYLAASEFDYPVQQILGTGCMLDTARLKYILGKHFGVDPKSVHGPVLGEHGYTAFPALSHTSLAGIPYADLAQHFPEVPVWSPEEVRQRVVHAAYEVADARAGVTNAAVAQASLDLSRAILLDQKTIYNVSTAFLDTDQALAISTPTVVGRQGFERRLDLALNDWEKEKLEESRQSILANIKLAQQSS